jgi:opacity protein-like surface antigen
LAVTVPVLFFALARFFLAAAVLAGGFCCTAVAAPALQPSASIAVITAQLSNVLMDSTLVYQVRNAKRAAGGNRVCDVEVVKWLVSFFVHKIRAYVIR